MRISQSTMNKSRLRYERSIARLGDSKGSASPFRADRFRRLHMTAICWQQASRPAGRVREPAPGRPLARFRATLREWRRRSREREKLASLDERMLSDIGLTRAEAEFLSHKPFWRE
jgi:uncharacterized protein YjiS (DUF1127 family)